MATFDLLYGQTANLETTGPHTVNMPSGKDGAVPTGARNLTNAAQTVTFTAQAGEVFYNATNGTGSNTTVDEIGPNTSRLWVYRPTMGWVIGNIDSSIPELVPALYGWSDQDTDTLFDIPALSYATLPLEAQFPVAPLSPRGVSFDLVNDTFSVDLPGPWLLGVDFNIEGHNSSNQGRTFFARVYDVTSAGPLNAGITLGIARNQEDLYVSSVYPLQVLPGKEGNQLRIELGGGDAVTGGTLINGGVWLSYIGQLGALI